MLAAGHSQPCKCERSPGALSKPFEFAQPADPIRGEVGIMLERDLRSNSVLSGKTPDNPLTKQTEYEMKNDGRDPVGPLQWSTGGGSELQVGCY